MTHKSTPTRSGAPRERHPAVRQQRRAQRRAAGAGAPAKIKAGWNDARRTKILFASQRFYEHGLPTNAPSWIRHPHRRFI